MKTKEIKELKEKLEKGNIKFSVKGLQDPDKYDEELKCFTYKDKEFRVSEGGNSIWDNINGMNVNKWGPTCVTLYTFDMLSNKTTGKIKYEDITIIE